MIDRRTGGCLRSRGEASQRFPDPGGILDPPSTNDEIAGNVGEKA